MRKLYLLCFVMMAGIAWPARAQTLKGNVYYDLGKARTKPAAGLIVYLIPDEAENSRIIKEYSTYTTSYDEDALKKAKGYKKAISNSDGSFYFTNISQGRYFFKVCTYYGGYYSVNIKSPFKGTIALPKFEADPPIR